MEIEKIIICLDGVCIATPEDHSSKAKEFYETLAALKLTRSNEAIVLKNVIPKVHSLLQKNMLRMDLILLSLIALRNFTLLNMVIDYEKTHFHFDWKSSQSLFNFCIFKKEHWISEFIRSLDSKNINMFTMSIRNRIIILQIIDLSVNEFEVDKLLSTMDEFKEDLDDTLNEFVQVFRKLVNTIQFCKNLKPDIDEKEVFNVLCNKNTLDTLSIFLNLQDHTYWPVIRDKLEDRYDELDPSNEFTTFTIFTILSRVINIKEFLRENNVSSNDELENIKDDILSLNNPILILEVLENIFTMLFLMENHFDEKKPPVFISNRIFLRSILYLIKGTFDILKLKNHFGKDSEYFPRFNKLSKYIHDAVWRLELVTDVKNNRHLMNDTKILSYMLAPPQSLLAMCMKQGNVIRARQVIEIFGLRENELSKELHFGEILKEARNDCKKIRRLKEFSQTTNSKELEDKLVKKIMDIPAIKIEREYEDALININEQNYLCHYKFENEKFMNFMDLLCTQSKDNKVSSIFLKLAEEINTLNSNIVSPYSKFCRNLLNVSEKAIPEMNLSISDVILSPNIPFDVEKIDEQKCFQEELISLIDQFKSQLLTDKDGILNSHHVAHKTFTKIENLCDNYSKKDPLRINYLGKLFNYLKAFSKVLYIEENTSHLLSKGKDTSYFSLLDYNRSELMGQLLFEKHLDPTEFEIYFTKMKLDFLYHLVGNCFPTINLHTEEFITEEELFPENNLYLPSQNIIQYIMKRNWLLALILKEMYNVPNIEMDINESRIQAFLNYKNLSSTQKLRCIFNNNEIITALQHEVPIHKVKNYLEKNIQKQSDIIMYSSQTSTSSDQSLESAEELIEDSLKSTDWKELLDVINSVPEIQMRKNKELRGLKDLMICNIIIDAFEYEYFRYVYCIDHREKRLETIIANISHWPAQFCMDVIKSELSNFGGCSDEWRNQLENWHQSIELCENLSKLLNWSTWIECRQAIEDNCEEIFKKVVDGCDVNIILLFINKYKLSDEALKTIDVDVFIKALANGCQLFDIQKLLNNVPYEHAISLCERLLKLSSDINQLQFFLDYLVNNTNDKKLRKKQLSLKIFSKFSNFERESILCSIDNPLNIVEMLLMNMKLDKLTLVLEVLRNELNDSEDGIISEEIDRILRIYAEKSLDFRVAFQPPQRRLKTPETKLIESFDSSVSENVAFLMPPEVPTKEQWVQNNEVSECMCCQNTVFSMFNRRHHCRRCGRVVCYMCSMKRMLVPSYADILVRVCKDCYEQTNGDSLTSERSETISSKSALNDNWLLTDDYAHNDIVRSEFSYEHAPSISLCLSIIKYHSHTAEYPKFLLEQCNKMLRILNPSQELLQEIDYLLVVKMVKSLATAAKMMSQECSLGHGMSTADKFLTQADLLGLFAERGCLNLLPTANNSDIPVIDSSVLRRLRDKLLEKEQWNLALEISTKAGLDKVGVFAAWGKSCLKAGCLTKAREKFQRCLDKRRRYESYSESIPEIEITEDGSFSGSNKTLNKSTEFIEKKPLKNPPLLNEIIHILESKTAVIDKNIVEEVNTSGISASTTTLNLSSTMVQRDLPLSIINKLQNLDYIASGKYYFPAERRTQTSVASNRPIVDLVFYNECIFYLNKYGSHQSILEFYMRHGELDQALQYILDNNMSGELFIEIYMKCLKEGLVNILQENISKIDSTLDLWKNYLRLLCRHLEKQNLLNSLYQLQLFMGDYMRASMTCIRFYQENTNNFSDLSRKNNFLHKAEEHLKQISEQDEWVEVTPVRQDSTDTLKSYEEKSITNPSLVMKQDTKNINIYLNTIWRQNEVASFLADCEAAGLNPMETLKYILPEDSDSFIECKVVPTLFGSNMDKVRLAILVLLTSVEVEQGFKIAIRLIQDFKLRPGTVYCQTGKHLAKMQKYNAIIELVQCLKKLADDDQTVTGICDEMLTLAVATLTKEKAPAAKVEDLIKLISDKPTKISAYIEAKQLKTAYFFAVRFKRMSDIRRILREAELNNQPHIKSLCLKVLQAQPQLPANTKDKD